MSLTPVLHHASCDICRSKIVGDRYKCTNCPNYDTCDTCFGLTEENHPNHTFVRIHQPEDYIIRRSPQVSHNARCNRCNRSIIGSRFKCMHPECPDYDLCQDCEALPISSHPDAHPLLKLRISDTKIPTFSTIPFTGQQPSEIKSEHVEDGRDPTPDPQSPSFCPPDYEPLQFATDAAWPRAVKVELGSQTAEVVKLKHEEVMRKWVEARGDDLPSDAYDYLAYSHGIAWPKAIVQCTTDAYFLLIRRRFLHIMDASSADL